MSGFIPYRSKFGLHLHSAKIQLIRFGRFSHCDCQLRRERKPPKSSFSAWIQRDAASRFGVPEVEHQK